MIFYWLGLSSGFLMTLILHGFSIYDVSILQENVSIGTYLISTIDRIYCPSQDPIMLGFQRLVVVDVRNAVCNILNL